MCKQAITIKLDWPPSTLSPNRRQHWAKLASAKKVYRHACYLATCQQRPGAVPDGDLHLTLRFSAKDRRRYDKDNLLARMKAGIDGVCDALGIDDVRFCTITVTTLRDLGGYVILEIGEDEDGYEKSL